jgi:hypothetical protein
MRAFKPQQNMPKPEKNVTSRHDQATSAYFLSRKNISNVSMLILILALIPHKNMLNTMQRALLGNPDTKAQTFRTSDSLQA